MQNIIEKIQNGDITDNELLTAIVANENKHVDEYNNVSTLLGLRDEEITNQNYTLLMQDKAIRKQVDNETIFKKNQTDIKKQSVAFQLENKTLKHQLAVLKKEAKATKEQTKRNKASNNALTAKIERLQKSKPKTDKTALHEMACVYSKGRDVLLVYPAKLELGIEDKRQDQVVLLYTDRKGCFVTVFLDNEDEVSCSSYINDDANVADRTKVLIRKNSMTISKEAAEFAQTWLIRVNRMQNMQIQPIDLTCFEGQIMKRTMRINTIEQPKLAFSVAIAMKNGKPYSLDGDWWTVTSFRPIDNTSEIIVYLEKLAI